MSNGNEELAARARAIIRSESDNFVELLRISGLDPKTDLRFADWSGLDFSGCDLRGYDFTGARLHGCKFNGALIEGARFDQAEIDRANLRAAKDWAVHNKSWKKTWRPHSSEHLPIGTVFRDALFSPEMVVIPPGRFWMGSDQDKEDSEEKKKDSDEHPRHEVTIPCALAIGRYPVTFEEWDFAQDDEHWEVIAGTSPRKPNDEGWGRDRRPVIHVSWEDSRAYCKWLSYKTGKSYRLPSEAEWEYSCRAGGETSYCFGDNGREFTRYAWFSGARNNRTEPVGKKKPNNFGLYDMHGNVWDWCEDCWNPTYEKKPEKLKTNGGAWISGNCMQRILRGGSWDSGPLGSARRLKSMTEYRYSFVGFRVTRTLIP
jgi:formylglycine-generating enzyme required for sulfatase activity